MKRSVQNENPSPKTGNRALWSLLFVVIAAATIWAVVSQNRAFSVRSFVTYVFGMSKGWLAAAAAGMLGFICFEGAALAAVCRAFGYPVRRRRALIYSASDIYFSAITPSASGGQPACAYFMIKDGIPGSVTTVALVANLAMYTIAILILGVLTLVLRPDVFLSFGLLSRALIVLGYLVQGLLAVFFLMLLFKGDLLHAICRGALRFLCAIRLLRHEEEKRKKLDGYMQEYAAYAQTLREHTGAMLRALGWNLLQRASVISVPFFLFLASGGQAAKAVDIWAVQCYAVIGSNTVPIPGAMGVSDYIMLDGFASVMPYQSAVDFELLSRSMSFYICIALCGITVLIAYLRQRKGERAA